MGGVSEQQFSGTYTNKWETPPYAHCSAKLIQDLKYTSASSDTA